MQDQDIVTRDVRPLLAAREEPFQRFIATADALTQGQVLRLLAPFRPAPLFRVMTQRGFTHQAKPLDGGDWQVDFARTDAAQELSPGSALEASTWPDPCVFLDLSIPGTQRLGPRSRARRPVKSYSQFPRICPKL